MEFLKEYSECTYLLAVVCATFSILKWYFTSTTKRQRNIVVTTVGLVFGIVWLEFMGSNLGALILAFFAAIGFYEKFVKIIMTKFKIEYDKQSNNGNTNYQNKDY